MNTAETAHQDDFQQFMVEKTLRQAWFDELESYTDVYPQELYCDETLGYTLQEYADEHGSVLASALFVPNGSHTWAWQIHANAGQGRYMEQHMVAAGRGRILIWDEGASEPRIIPISEAEADAGKPIIIKPGQTFQVIADPEPETTAEGAIVRGLFVCAFFRSIPFELAFEHRDPELTAAGLAAAAEADRRSKA